MHGKRNPGAERKSSVEHGGSAAGKANDEDKMSVQDEERFVWRNNEAKIKIERL